MPANPINPLATPATPNDPAAPVDVSIILINWRMASDLAQCLASIEAHQHRCRAEVVLVNKPSEDGTEELIRTKYPWVKLIEHPTFGFATMRNAGIRNSTGRYCLVLDTDIEILPGCFDELVGFMDRHPKLAGCGGHTTRLNGDLEYNVKRFYDLATVIVRRSPLDRYWPNNPWNRRHLMMDKDHARPFEGDWMAGACFCMRREAIAQAGFFDENMHYFEDVDWCWRAKQCGWRIGFCPRGRIIHKVQQLSKKWFNRNAMIHLWSGLRFWWKVRHQGINWAWPNRPMVPPRRAHSPGDSTLSADLSVIVVNYSQERLLRDCLNSLRNAAPRHRLDVIVIDNASSDDSVAMVRREFPDARLVANADNLGFTKANNQGMEIAHGRHLMLLNNDTRVLPGAFSAAIDWLDQHPEAGVAGLKLLNEDKSLQLSCRRFPSFSQALFNRHSLLTQLLPKNRFSREYLMMDFRHDKIQDVDWVSGACLVIRREAYEDLGGLDERFFMYSEDVDYCYRVWEAGYHVVYLPFARVIHLIGQSSRKNRTLTILERHRSMYKFYKKHYSRNLMFVDAVTWLMINLRCLAQLAGERARALLGSAT